MRVCCEYQAYIEPHVMRIVRALLNRIGDPHSDESTYAMHMIAGEARTIEGRLSKGPWIVGDKPGASDYMIYPGIKLLLRALALPEARELSSRFVPVEANYPALEPLAAACRIAAGLRANVSAALARRHLIQLLTRAVLQPALVATPDDG